ncbi:MAG TPA: RNase adapter RapZ [Gammaproteobacteria bacterium]|nr:RNase adapter RapZ [Gammaproteobacteria bacterium]
MPSKPARSRHLVLLSGLSGSGKTVALNMLEDLGYYCVDNMPARLLGDFARATVATDDPAYEWMAIGVDARNPPEELNALPRLVRELEGLGVTCRIVFLRASEDTLIKRYSETRRKHPLSGAHMSLKEAISLEARLLAPLAENADLTLDTSRTTLHDLRELVRRRVHTGETESLSILFESFAFRNGVPSDADFVFDVRCLPNPHWEPALRHLTGKDPAVVAYLEAHATVRQMVRDITTFLETWMAHFEAGDRSYLTIAIGCTGGQHRSVYVVERLAEHFRKLYDNVTVRHHETE